LITAKHQPGHAAGTKTSFGRQKRASKSVLPNRIDATLKNLGRFHDCRALNGAYVLHCRRPPQAIVALVKHLEAQNNELISLEIFTPSLEDVFIELTGRRLRD